MNAPALVVEDSTEVGTPVNWPALTCSVNLWRGRCLHLLARAEAAISEAPLRLAPKADNLPTLVGARYDTLDQLLTARTDPPAQAALAALRTMRQHDQLRVFLCHGVSTPLSDRKGEWNVLLRLLAFRNGAAVRDELFLTAAKAEATRAALNAAGQRLEHSLAALP